MARVADPAAAKNGTSSLPPVAEYPLFPSAKRHFRRLFQMTISKLEKQIKDRGGALARRHRRLVKTLTAYLGGEKPDQAELAIIKQAALITLECEQMTTAYLNGEPVSRNDIVRMTNAATRLLETIGIEKEKRQPVKATFVEQIVAKRGKNKGVGHEEA